MIAEISYITVFTIVLFFIKYKCRKTTTESETEYDSSSSGYSSSDDMTIRKEILNSTCRKRINYK